MTVAHNVAFPLEVRKVKRTTVDERVKETLELVEMSVYAGRFPHELSGGQQQRVALARALIYRPSVLLLDEPFSNLDAKLRERARTWLKDLQNALGLTTVFVTHDQDEALSMSDRILVMDHGVILQSGTPEEVYQQPATRFVAEFLGHCNILTARVLRNTEQGGATVAIQPAGEELTLAEPGLSVGQMVDLVLRPEAIHLSENGTGSKDNSFTAEVRSTSFMGDHYAYQLDAGGLALSARSSVALGGPRVTVEVPRDACRVVPR